MVTAREGLCPHYLADPSTPGEETGVVQQMAQGEQRKTVARRPISGGSPESSRTGLQLFFEKLSQMRSNLVGKLKLLHVRPVVVVGPHPAGWLFRICAEELENGPT